MTKAMLSLDLLEASPQYADLLGDIRNTQRNWLVTGGAGFIGSHLAQTLLGLGQRVTILDNLSTGRQLNLDAIQTMERPAHARVEIHEADIRDASAVARLADGADVILHHAAQVSVPASIDDPIATHEVNVTGFLHVLEAARANDATVVYAASSASYGDDDADLKQEDRLGRALSLYAASKTSNETYAAAYHAAYGLKTVGLRYFNVFGARQDPSGAYAAVIPAWIDAHARGEACRIHGDGLTTRDFCHVANVTAAVLLAATQDTPEVQGHVFNVGTGHRTTLLELHDAIASAVARQRPELTVKEPVFGPFRAGDVRHSCANVDRARERLGFVPVVDLQTGIDATVDATL